MHRVRTELLSSRQIAFDVSLHQSASRVSCMQRTTIYPDCTWDFPFDDIQTKSTEKYENRKLICVFCWSNFQRIDLRLAGAFHLPIVVGKFYRCTTGIVFLSQKVQRSYGIVTDSNIICLEWRRLERFSRRFHEKSTTFSSPHKGIEYTKNLQTFSSVTKKVRLCFCFSHVKRMETRRERQREESYYIYDLSNEHACICL